LAPRSTSTRCRRSKRRRRGFLARLIALSAAAAIAVAAANGLMTGHYSALHVV
jgi:hypothetical protein